MIMTDPTDDGAAGPGSDAPALLVADDRGTVTAWNSAAEQLLGYSGPEIIGRSVKDVLVGVPDGHNDADIVLRHKDGHHIGCRVRVRAEQGRPYPAAWKAELWPTKEATASAAGMALLESLFTCSPVGLYIVDNNLRLVRYNPAAEGMQGTPEEEVRGLLPTEAWPGESAEIAERVLTEVLKSGDPVLGYEKRGYPPADPDRLHVYSASAFRLQDRDGQVLGVGSIAVDVSERHRAQQRLALVAEAGSRIGTTLDVLHTAGELADVVVPQLADSVAVDLLAPVVTGEEVPDRPDHTGWNLRRAASRSVLTDGSRPLSDDARISDHPASTLFAQVLDDHEPRLIPVLGENPSAGMDPSRIQRMREERVHSLMVVPLLVRDCALGIVSFHRWSAHGAFEDDDLTLAQDLAARAAVALDNARRYVRERNAVVALQHNLIPQGFPVAHTVRAANHLVHSGAGGDWTDVIALPGARVALVTGSTPGRGVHTVATMARLRTAVQTLAALDLAPDEVMARLDDLVRHMDTEANHSMASSPVGASCLYAVYDPVGCACTVAAAGSPGLALADRHSVELPDIPSGPPLGQPGPAFGKVTMRLRERSRLVLFTPGLLQAVTGDAGMQSWRVCSPCPTSHRRTLP